MQVLHCIWHGSHQGVYTRASIPERLYQWQRVERQFPRDAKGGRALAVGANLERHLGARRELDAPIVRDVLLAEEERVRAHDGLTPPSCQGLLDLLCQGLLDVQRKGDSVSRRDEAIAELREKALDCP